MKTGTHCGDSDGGSSEYLDLIYVFKSTVPEEIHTQFMGDNSYSNLRTILEYIWIYFAMPNTWKMLEYYKFLEDWSERNGNKRCHMNSI